MHRRLWTDDGKLSLALQRRRSRFDGPRGGGRGRCDETSGPHLPWGIRRKRALDCGATANAVRMSPERGSRSEGDDCRLASWRGTARRCAPVRGVYSPTPFWSQQGSGVEPKTLITFHHRFRSARVSRRASLWMANFQWVRSIENVGPCLARAGGATSQRFRDSALADTNGGTSCVGHRGGGAASRRDWPGERPRSRGARARKNAC